jgi:regulator of sigma D
MLDSCQNAQERWGGVHKLIDRWLLERQELVVAFRALRDAKPAFADKAQSRDFCGVLVDYVSAWHFEVFEQLLSEAKAFDDKRALALAEDMTPRITDITQIALDFNDHCDKAECNGPDPASTGRPSARTLRAGRLPDRSAAHRTQTGSCTAGLIASISRPLPAIRFQIPTGCRVRSGRPPRRRRKPAPKGSPNAIWLPPSFLAAPPASLRSPSPD